MNDSAPIVSYLAMKLGLNLFISYQIRVAVLLNQVLMGSIGGPPKDDKRPGHQVPASYFF
jgi:hypothetical protein